MIKRDGECNSMVVALASSVARLTRILKNTQKKVRKNNLSIKNSIRNS